MSAIGVRRGRARDAADVARMANALNRALGVDLDSFTPERVREDAFGPEPLVSVLVGELNGQVAGYAFYHAGGWAPRS